MSGDRCPASLSLNNLTPDRAAARLLPYGIAKRCRALPIAQEGGCITVAMADPTDRVACEEVTAALRDCLAGQGDGAPWVYQVGADPALIDAWLADLTQADDGSNSGEPEAAPPDIWLREPLHGDKAAVIAYAEQIAARLGTPLRRIDPLAAGLGQPPAAFLPQHGLVIMPCLDYNLASALQANGDGGCAAVLFACRPRWPLHRLLLIVRGDPVDDAALIWATRLARVGIARVTALLVAPYSPSAHAPSAHGDISNLLSPANAAGHRMQHVAQSLAATQLDAVLHLRQGAPEAVIREEMASTPYDLVVAGVDVRSSGAQWRLRPLLNKLLPELACPLLLTRS